jgi:DNA excision repair protein ERCC-6
LYEPIDEQDLVDYDPDTFCGTGYVVVTTYESIRRNDDIWTRHAWSYVVMDEGQKIRNPDADITLACKVSRSNVAVW